MRTYIDELYDKVQEATGLKGKELIKVYSLLVLVKGENITLQDVHDAWSIVMNYKEANPPYCYGHEHHSIIPFDNLSAEVKAKDQKYVTALIEVAKSMKPNNYFEYEEGKE